MKDRLDVRAFALAASDGWLGRVVLAALIVIGSTMLTSGIVVAFVVRIPAGYFLASGGTAPRAFESRLAKVGYLVGKNLLGLALVGAGLVMALPGVPGQGLLTMLVGLMLVDLPGKRRFELAVVRRPAVRRALDAIRARFDQPPLELDGS
jgi:hypothetical protein